MTDEDLIARLRDDSGNWLTDDAAGRIEQLAATNEALIAEVKTSNEIGLAFEQDAGEQRERAKKAEAERDAAVEMLIELEKWATETSRLGAVTGGHWTRLTIACLNARTTLAKIKEGGL
jgi:hypothetical protein